MGRLVEGWRVRAVRVIVMLPRGGRNGRRNTDLFKLRALEERTTLDLKCVGNLCLRVCCLGDPLSRLSVCASALILSRYTIHNLYTSPIKKGQCKYRIVSVSAEPLIHYVNRMCHVSDKADKAVFLPRPRSSCPVGRDVAACAPLLGRASGSAGRITVAVAHFPRASPAAPVQQA